MGNQKPSANFAWSLIRSGVHGGDQTSSASLTPGISRIVPISAAICGPARHPIEVSEYVTVTLVASSTSTS